MCGFYVVRNRGSETSAERWLHAELAVTEADSVSVPALAPGDSVTGEFEFVVTASWLLYTEHPFNRMGSAQRVQLRLTSPDAVPDNDVLLTPTFMLTVPALELHADEVGVPRIRVNEPFSLGFALYNRSRHETLPAIPLAICMWDFDLNCAPDWGRTLTAAFTTPPLAPGDSLVEQRVVAVEPSAVWQDEAFSFTLSLCALPVGWTDPYAPDSYAGECAFSNVLRVRPDYDACEPPLLHVGETAALSAYNCGVLPPTTQSHRGEGPDWYNQRLADYRFHLFAVELLAGVEYLLMRGDMPVAPHYVLDAEGERAFTAVAGGVFTVPRSGRHYLVLYGQLPELEVTLTAP